MARATALCVFQFLSVNIPVRGGLTDCPRPPCVAVKQDGAAARLQSGAERAEARPPETLHPALRCEGSPVLHRAEIPTEASNRVMKKISSLNI